MTNIKRLHLQNFRIHKSFDYEGEHDFIFLEGPNGSGKTSVLEAISYCAPGRGLRNTSFDEAIKHSEKSWSLFSNVSSNDIGMSCGVLNRRIIKVNGNRIKSSINLLEFVKIIWLTPSEDALLASPKTIRRKFLDRLTYNFDANHASDIVKYEHLLRSRLKLLKSGSYDGIWVTQLEKILSELTISIVHARLSTISRLKDSMDLEIKDLIMPQISLECKISNNIDNLNIEFLSSEFYKARNLDAKIGRSLFGIHRSDFIIKNELSKASKSSTGELKIMLLNLILSQIKSLNFIEKVTPVLLLDDIFSHLDEYKIASIVNQLSLIDAQIWITGTNFNEIHNINKCKNFVKIVI